MAYNEIATKTYVDSNAVLESEVDELAIDATPTEGSGNLVTSGGVHTAINSKQEYIGKLESDGESGYTISGITGAQIIDAIVNKKYVAIDVNDSGQIYTRIPLTNYAEDSARYYAYFQMQTLIYSMKISKSAGNAISDISLSYQSPGLEQEETIGTVTNSKNMNRVVHELVTIVNGLINGGE